MNNNTTHRYLAAERLNNTTGNPLVCIQCQNHENHEAEHYAGFYNHPDHCPRPCTFHLAKCRSSRAPDLPSDQGTRRDLDGNGKRPGCVSQWRNLREKGRRRS